MNLKNIIASITLASLIASPANASDSADRFVKNDGYRFVEKQFEKKQVTIEVVTFQTKKEFLEAAKSRGITNTNIAAFSILREPYDKCTIYMIDPQKSFKPDMAGHEFLHCFYGQWHSNNNQR